MEYVIIAVVLIIIIVVIAKSMAPKIKKKNTIDSLKQYISKTKIKHEFTELKNGLYDVNLKINDHEYAIKVVVIPNYSEIQINNRSTWEVKYGAGNTPGKAQPHKRYLVEVSSFMRRDLEPHIEKIVLFAPKPKKIVKYINECEIVFVNSKTDVYGARIFSQENYLEFKKK